MTDIKMRTVAIAQDVLSQLNNPRDKMQPERRNTYLASNAMIPWRYDENDLQSYVDDLTLKVGCEVCALGALLISKARLYDEVPVDDVSACDDNGGMIDFDATYESIVKLLKDSFDEETLILIESTFEWPLSEEVNRINSATDRLREIMQNIVDNNGDFVSC